MMEILRSGAARLGVTIDDRHLLLFQRYYDELTIWNERFNLTAICGYEAVQVRHFLDALTCLLAFPFPGASGQVADVLPPQRLGSPLRCVDVGSGAGFPGLPIKIVLPDVAMTLIEATGKKVRFLRHLVDVLQLRNVRVLHARAEDVGRLAEHREAYDVVLARAVARMAILAEYCLPLCRVGGRLIAPKGEDAEGEARGDTGAIRTLGGHLATVKRLDLPEISSPHYLVVVDKVGHTTNDYPRRPGVPAKHPLS